MILVDTSIWIDFFAGRDLPHVSALEGLIQDNEDIAVCGIILTEILQGISNDATFRHVQNSLSPLIMAPMSDAVFLRAAKIYRRLRKRGITIRRTSDCIIAATALEHGCSLLHNDRDFDPIKAHLGLEVIKI